MRFKYGECGLRMGCSGMDYLVHYLSQYLKITTHKTVNALVIIWFAISYFFKSQSSWQKLQQDKYLPQCLLTAHTAALHERHDGSKMVNCTYLHVIWVWYLLKYCGITVVVHAVHIVCCSIGSSTGAEAISPATFGKAWERKNFLLKLINNLSLTLPWAECKHGTMEEMVWD